VQRVRTRVARALSSAGVRPGEGLIVGCSHGPDSLVLADAVLGCRPALSLGEVCLVYVDHGLRSESVAEGDAVRAFAAARGVRARVETVAVRRQGRGLEDAARAARHAALERAADQLGARWIALGHTQSDQAETLLLRLLRGAGVVGLAGIPPVRGPYVRPLLGISRAEVLAYVAEVGLRPSTDASNQDPAFLRNRVRHQLLPALRAENPALDEALGRTATALREQAEALDWAVDRALERVGRSLSPTEIRLGARELAALPVGVAKRLLVRLSRQLGASLEARHLEALLGAAARPSAGTRAACTLPGLVARREYQDLVLGGVGAEPDAPEAPPLALRDSDAFTVRSWQPGDRMRPVRLKGRSRKLQDLYTDQKISVIQRRSACVVVRKADGAIVWAEHIGVALDIDLEI
jgi:tRNA(Ile)-lysidine synthase